MQTVEENAALTGVSQVPTIAAMNPDELKAWRNEQDMTQTELARELGVDIMTVSRWERALRSIPPFLGLALNWIAQERKRARKRPRAQPSETKQ